MKNFFKSKFVLNILLFVGTFLIVIFVQGKYKVNCYYYDVVDYKNIGVSLFTNGHYSLSNISTDFRGFVFPTYMGFANLISNNPGNWLIYIYISFWLSLLFVPYINFCEEIFSYSTLKKVPLIIRSLISTGLVIIFFYGLIIHPLTDLYAALLCIDTGYVIYKAMCSEKIKKFALYFIAGILIYLTYNIRTIYQLTLFAFVLFIAFCEFKKDKKLNCIFSLLAYVLGVLVGAIPQIIINYNLYNNFSLWINNNNLFAKQLYWGLQYSRYATCIQDYFGGMYFVDSIGTKVINEWIALNLPITIKSYIILFFKYPLEYIAIFGKHVWNISFVLYPEQYVQNLDKNLILNAISSLMVVFLFAVTLFVYLQNKKVDWKKIILIFTLVIPSIAILFGAVEERFMVLPYLLVYGFLAFFDYTKLKKFLTKKRVIILLLIFVIFAVTAFSVEGDILSSLKDHPLTFNN